MKNLTAFLEQRNVLLANPEDVSELNRMLRELRRRREEIEQQLSGPEATESAEVAGQLLKRFERNATERRAVYGDLFAQIRLDFSGKRMRSRIRQLTLVPSDDVALWPPIKSRDVTVESSNLASPSRKEDLSSGRHSMWS